MKKAGILKIFRNCKKGAAAIEFALIAPVFFLMIFGIVEFGLTVFVDATLQHALRMSARSCMVQLCEQDDFRAKMQQYMGGLYKDDPAMKVVAMAVPKLVNDRPTTAGGLYPPRVRGLISNPLSIFTAAGAYPSAADQQGQVMIYGAKYKWGGFTGLMAPFIPDNIYAITVVRNEF